METYKVTGSFCLEIEDVESEEKAKQAALEQLSDCFRYYPAETALNVKVEKEKNKGVKGVRYQTNSGAPMG